MMKATIIVKGMVQGIGFRNFVRVNAKYNSVNGIARNRSDGSVEIFVEGAETDINKLLEILKSPAKASRASVESVELSPEGSNNYKGPWKDYRDKFLVDERNSD